jgi:cytochrome oxidase Cu insertion factor (SCO1/SenC/PrrC family)
VSSLLAGDANVGRGCRCHRMLAVVAVGDLAPDFELPDQDGNEVSLSGLRGKSVVLYLYPKAEASARKNSLA